ncbi:DUF4125 family protein [Serinibacter salmoneus]|uniref:Uncharacterized protein DUF4125 n=1 Tax=Serinibacter salmoneus TaxID=556530 RepID=A0A2A9D3K6_9MICO|nr:DUF4125 family protein [Serinibacter salmoneus]PFG21287.1 uncharacterized protein DUF4125 [Serinibacter salmoneus]
MTHPVVAAAEEVVAQEWQQFQEVQGLDGRAQCQDDWPTFHQMRISQFLAWPLALIESYSRDLAGARSVGRNLVSEKYGRMMADTDPIAYARDIAPVVQELPEQRIAQQEEVVTTQVAWAADFMARYPRLGAGMRVLRTAQDTPTETSFETYLRGELGSYSGRTFAMYRAMIAGLRSEGGNLTEQILGWTVRLAGYPGLAEAEAAQPQH